MENVLQGLSNGFVNLLSSTYSEMQELIQTVNSQLETLARHFGNIYAWKMREAVVVVLGSLSKDILLFNSKAKKNGKVQIEIGNILYQVVLKDLTNSKDMLRGRAL